MSAEEQTGDRAGMDHAWEEEAGRQQDAVLVRLAKQGDGEAFGRLVDKYKRRVYRVAYQLVRNHAEADDLAQETFVRAFRAIGRFREGASFYTWLYRINVNVCLSYHRRRAREERRFVDVGEGVGRIRDVGRTDPALRVVHQELATQIDAAIRELPASQQAVIVLKEIEGLSHEEVAFVLGRSSGSVRSLLYYARRQLREKLKPYLESGTPVQVGEEGVEVDEDGVFEGLR